LWKRYVNPMRGTMAVIYRLRLTGEREDFMEDEECSDMGERGVCDGVEPFSEEFGGSV
jgi:hypothetical protein